MPDLGEISCSGYLGPEQLKDVATVSDQALSKQRREVVDRSKESKEMTERLGREVSWVYCTKNIEYR